MSKKSNSSLNEHYDLNADMLGYIIFPFKIQSRIGNVFIKMIQPSLKDKAFRNSANITGLPIVAVGFTYLQ